MVRGQVEPGTATRAPDSQDSQQTLERGVSTFVRTRFSPALLILLSLGLAGATLVFVIAERTLLPGGLFRDAGALELMEEDRRFGARIPPRTEVFREWQGSLQSFEAMTGVVLVESSVRGAGSSLSVANALVTPGFFELFGLVPTAGGLFGEGDFTPGASAVILSESLARAVLGGVQSAVGQSLVLDGRSLTVVGILPDGFGAVVSPELEIGVVSPLDLSRQELVQVFARRATGVSLARARAELDAWSKAQSAQLTDAGNIRWVLLSPLERLDSTTRRLLQAAVLTGLVLLLVTAANVAHLLAASARAQSKETATRWALGASRGRLFGWKAKQLVGLALAATILTVALSHLLLLAVSHRLPENLRFLAGMRVGVSALAFALAASVLSTLPWILAPLGLRGEGGLRRALAADPKFEQPAPFGRALSSLQIVSIAAGSFVLSVLTFLLGRTTLALGAADLGFEMDGLTAVSVTLPDWKYDDVAKRTAYFAAVAERLSTFPRVRSYAFATSIPPQAGVIFGEITGEDGKALAAVGVGQVSVGSGYFSTLRQPILFGRELSEEQVKAGAPVVVISRSLAAVLAQPPEAAVGQTIRFGNDAREVVGVAADLEIPTPLRAFGHQTYWPLSRYRPTMSVLVRGPSDVSPSLRRMVESLDPDVVVKAEPTREAFAKSVASTRFLAVAVSLLTLMTLGLAFFGVYAVLTRFATQQRGQIAVRMAVGATPAQVRAWVVRRGLLRALAGVGIGLFVSYPASRLVAHHLYGIEHDSLAARLVSIVLLLAGVFAASYVPAARASSIDPGAILKGT